MAAVALNGNDPNGNPPKTKGLTRGQLKRLKQKQKPKRPTTHSNINGVSSPKNDTEGSADQRDETKEDDKTDNLHSSASSVIDDVLIGTGDLDNPTRELFADVFAKFQPTDQDASAMEEEKSEDPGKGQVIYSDDEMPSDGDSDAPKPDVSKRKQRKMARLTVAELKRLVKKPEVVEWVDVTAQDPKLLVQLKSYRNTVPIPIHWSQKRDYLQGKRGIEKPAFQLPSYIADTGIATQRDAIKEKESEQSLRQKTRERVQPKMGKIDIDYQKLHDAFFKYQVPPVMTKFGEMYHEGKEFETKLKEKRPGDLSEDLKEALSIPPLAPPPWLIAMQRYGPPPSYPNLKIPGLNAPIPDGAQWGYHPGGWGKPPTDEFGRPLYGDVFGQAPKFDTDAYGEPVSKELWGEVQSDEEDESEEESEEDSDGEGAGPSGDGTQTPTGLETPSGLASITSTVPGGLETPDFIELRKRREGTGAVEPEADNGPKSLYHVIPEKETKITGFMGSDRVYDVRGISQHGHNVSMLGQEDRGTKRKANGVDVALDPSELEGLSEEQLRQRYEESRQRSSGGGVGNQQGGREDLSDLVAQESAKRKGRADGTTNPKNRDREKEKFKF
ncbi:hypothetical protein PTTG_09767 [Puccinia triticina 1-1 BBBD Race 1]|uniref:PSP domain-containing protein n=2 Tax=Puccinia triticina TaxID=208348 RepID=A0A180GQK0_PUCT1|nr:uncharacterized protein PtA15_16A53 [Puccinia triticina]OAV95030.1 hypothetical protein PTTG_09767 [Puccinia triticina 1-1 BBBD Race 1]WAQ92147.1 hypothetical protein PtA15_16A53 [Puccinia triticina]WAR63888.1 hypothetical protein PtB15_16B47 [Puccinia triticina]